MMHDLTIKKFHEGLLKKEFSVTDIVSESIKQIEKENGRLNVFLDVFADEAKKKARELDDETPKTPLFGVPMAIKDNILIRGTRMTAGSKILETYESAYDATVVEKLRAQDAIFLGKVNLDEFAMGSSTENSAFGVTKNPYDDTKVAGGSSGGSAAAVAADMALGSLGSDTGGSIREPASFCGVVGMKPTYGAVSRHGVAALGSSLDQIGPFAKTVEDVEYIFDAIKGGDRFDPTSAEFATSNLQPPTSKLKIGVPKEYFVEGMDPYVEKEILDALDVFKKQGYEIKEVSLPHTKYALSCYYIIMPAEASSNLGRYDGLRYGRQGLGLSDQGLVQTYMRNRGEGFGEEATRRILLGTFVLSAGYYDAYYAKAQKVRRKIQEDFDSVFSPSGGGVDVLFTPVVPFTAFGIGEKASDPLAMYLSDIFTIPANLAGVPALSIPVRKRSEYSKDRMPVNFQLVGKHFHEGDLFMLGKHYEQV